MLDGMDRRDGMRAADADREVVAGRLRTALDEGRLHLHEYDERLQQAYTARTYGELNAVVADLPGPGVATTAPQPLPVTPVEPSVPGSSPPAGRSATTRWLADNWEPYLTAVGVTVAVWAMISIVSGEFLYFWPGWVAGPWGVVLVVSTVFGLAKGEPQRWAAEEERKRQRKAEKKERKRELKAARERELTSGPTGEGDSGKLVRDLERSAQEVARSLESSAREVARELRHTFGESAGRPGDTPRSTPAPSAPSTPAASSAPASPVAPSATTPGAPAPRSGAAEESSAPVAGAPRVESELREDPPRRRSPGDGISA
jgi:hypothetical protein